MQGGRLVAELVVHIDDYSVANGSLDAWYGPLSIDPNDRPFEKTIRVSSDPTYVEVVGTDFGVNQRN